MSLTVKTNAPAPVGGFQLNPRLNGFTKPGLVNLHRLAEATPHTAYLDDITNTTAVPVVMNGGGFGTPAASALAGGGVRLVNRIGMPFKTPLNNAQPWTIAAALTLNPNATLMPANRNVYLLGGYAAAIAGLTLYLATPVGSAPTAATQMAGIVVREFETGGAVLGTAPVAAGLNYATSFVMFVEHAGGGSGFLKLYRLGVLVSQLAFTMNLTVERGTPGTDQITYAIGASTGEYDALDMNVEAMAQWSKALTTAEEIINYNAFAALAAARGRTFV
jgi:hypothetical protein